MKHRRLVAFALLSTGLAAGAAVAFRRESRSPGHASAAATLDSGAIDVVPPTPASASPEAGPAAPPEQRVIGIAAGGQNSCAWTDAGGVFCWGNNGYGQLGNGSTSGPGGPTRVVAAPEDPPMTKVVEVAVAEDHACARSTDGQVQCWGANEHGQLGNGTVTADPPHAALVRVAPGGAPLTDVAQIAAGSGRTCARKTDGTAVCWGPDALGDGEAHASPVPVRAAGGIAPLDGIAQIATSGYDWWTPSNPVGCARRTNGTVVCWGQECGDLCAGARSLKDVARLALGSRHACALRKDGTVVCWGSNYAGELGDGTVTAPRATPSLVRMSPRGPTLTDVVDIVAGMQHTCARRKEGYVLCWGGEGPRLEAHPSPQHVATYYGHVLADATALVAGQTHNCALRSNSEVLCWGRNDFGTSPPAYAPVAMRIDFPDR